MNGNTRYESHTHNTSYCKYVRIIEIRTFDHVGNRNALQYQLSDAITRGYYTATYTHQMTFDGLPVMDDIHTFKIHVGVIE